MVFKLFFQKIFMIKFVEYKIIYKKKLLNVFHIDATVMKIVQGGFSNVMA